MFASEMSYSITPHLGLVLLTLLFLPSLFFWIVQSKSFHTLMLQHHELQRYQSDDLVQEASILPPFSGRHNRILLWFPTFRPSQPSLSSTVFVTCHPCLLADDSTSVHCIYLAQRKRPGCRETAFRFTSQL